MSLFKLFPFGILFCKVSTFLLRHFIGVFVIFVNLGELDTRFWSCSWRGSCTLFCGESWHRLLQLLFPKLIYHEVLPVASFSTVLERKLGDLFISTSSIRFGGIRRYNKATAAASLRSPRWEEIVRHRHAWHGRLALQFQVAVLHLDAEGEENHWEG